MPEALVAIAASCVAWADSIAVIAVELSSATAAAVSISSKLSLVVSPQVPSCSPVAISSKLRFGVYVLGIVEVL